MVLGAKMDWAYQIAVRTAPAIASGLVSLGVAASHSEAIALGIVLGVVSFAELAFKAWNKRKQK